MATSLDSNLFDTLHRLDVGDLTGGAEDHTSHCRLRNLRRRGLVTMVVLEGEPVWTVTESGRVVLDRRARWEERQEWMLHT
jgi:hypothetical protein